MTVQELAAATMEQFWQEDESRRRKLIPILRRQLKLLSLVVTSYEQNPRKMKPGSCYNKRHDKLLYCSRGWSRYTSVSANLRILKLIDETACGSSYSRGLLQQEIDMDRVHPLWLRYYRLLMNLNY